MGGRKCKKATRFASVAKKGNGRWRTTRIWIRLNTSRQFFWWGDLGLGLVWSGHRVASRLGAELGRLTLPALLVDDQEGGNDG